MDDYVREKKYINVRNLENVKSVPVILQKQP